ncbi:MAG: hypothetical protein QGH33_02815 [Pirellulaceae bacterium]|nr:hypothetical protein [Pirellulaceae bacterium]
MPQVVRISLANKCQLLFGLAVVLILTAALTVVWQRMQKLVNAGLEVTAHKLAEAYLSNMIQVDLAHLALHGSVSRDWAEGGFNITVIMIDEFESATQRDPFLAEAIERFETHSDRNEMHRPAVDEKRQHYHRYWPRAVQAIPVI